MIAVTTTKQTQQKVHKLQQLPIEITTKHFAAISVLLFLFRL